MFTNIGGKIKVFVIVATILNIFACIIYGGIMITYAILGDKMLGFLSATGLDKAVVDMMGGARGAFGITAGIIIIIAGSFACWLIAFIPYGLGQMIQNSDRLVKNTEAIKTSLSKIHQTQQENNASMPYGMFPYPVYTDQFGRPIYPAPGFVTYPGEEAAAEDVLSQNAAKSENTPASDAQTNTNREEEKSDRDNAIAENTAQEAEEKTSKEKHSLFAKKSDKHKNKDGE